MSISKESRTFEVTERQAAYLREMAEKYDLPDESKALRCLITFAIEEQSQEHDIFNVIRCQGCG